MNVLSVENLRVEYRRSGKRIPAVRNVSFSMAAGESLGIAGESGSGKSTLGLALLRLIPEPAILTATRLTFDGAEVLSMKSGDLRDLRGGAMGIVFQDPFSSMNPVLTVGEQVEEVLERHSGGRNRHRVLSLFGQVRLPDPAGLYAAYPHQLSGGQRQRVCLAMAIAGNPKLLIADEPTTALDVTVQREILNLLDDLRRELHMALLLITHNVGLLSERTDRLAILYAGEIVEIGPTSTVLKTPAHPYTQGLLKSLPRLTGTESRLPALPGQPPGPLDIPMGCPFHPRCSQAFDLCFSRAPVLRSHSTPGVQVSCHLYAEAVP
ncbi:MAG: ABC transporter ATP-binding protein [Elusimicrobia bacterium]|nr:ABC transporter ATP-binding protein [Elusimicrobiota bacterium]